MGKFVKAKVIQYAEDLTHVRQLPDNIIAIRMITSAYMLDHADEISRSSFSSFFSFLSESLSR